MHCDTSCGSSDLQESAALRRSEVYNQQLSAAVNHTTGLGALFSIVQHGQGMGGEAYLALEPCTQPCAADINAGKSSGK